MLEWTTYFSVVDTVGGWTASANAVDNNTGTYATNTGFGMQTLILDTPSAASELGTISKVEIRAYCSLGDLGVPVKLRLTPRFIGGDGDYEVIAQNLGWTSWYDITEDTNAPGSWAWSDVEALGAKFTYYWGSGPVPLAQLASIEIKVTYTGAPPPPSGGNMSISGGGAMTITGSGNITIT